MLYAETPIPAGTVIFIGKTDDNDPDSSLEAFLVVASPEDGDEIWKSLGNSFGAEDQEHFVWMVRSLAAFHGLQVQVQDGLEPPK